MNPFKVLGLASNASVAAAKEAYRALRTKHHPDHGGDRRRFQEIKEAWEKIEGGYRDKPVDANDQFRRYSQAAYRPGYDAHYESELIVSVSLLEAYAGFTVSHSFQRRSGPEQVSFEVPPGTPDGHRSKYTAGSQSAIITTRIDGFPFRVRGFDDSDNLFSAGSNIGDVELDYEIDALDLITGGWITVEDFLCEKLSVRVPAGFDPLLRLKVVGKGYCGWIANLGVIDHRRQDLYVKLRPKFNKPAEIDRQKIINLYNAVRNQDES